MPPDIKLSNGFGNLRDMLGFGWANLQLEGARTEALGTLWRYGREGAPGSKVLGVK